MWGLLAAVVLATWVAGQWAAQRAQAQLAAAAQQRLQLLANQGADALAARLEIRLAALRATAAQWGEQASSPAALQASLRALQGQQPELSWLGLADSDGAWRASTTPVAQPQAWPVSQWLAQAQGRPLVLLHRSPGQGEIDRLLLALPLPATPSQPTGLLLAQLPWLWLQAEVDAQLRALDAGGAIELLLTDGQGQLLAGPATALASSSQAPAAPPDLTEAGRYLLARAQAPAEGVGWQLWVREPSASALALAQHAYRVVLWGVLGGGLLLALAVLLVARLAHGQAERAALQQRNAELDARVAQRTARIEQLAQEARQAAVARERLRLARGLHDTLAHSLMALLTQIRLLRKLGGSWSAEQWADELCTCEELTRSGLHEARAAIGQLRSTGVQDNGLGPELQALLAPWAQRCGWQLQAEMAPQAAELVDDHAATVYDMVRELLRNIERHAQARHVLLALQPLPAEGGEGVAPWRLFLRDDGRGFDLNAPRAGHFGLLGLQEQAQQIGAQLHWRSSPGQGCAVELLFHVKQALI